MEKKRIREILSSTRVLQCIFFIAAVAIDWFVVIFAHRSNIRRLFGGCENKTGTGKLFGKKEK